MSQEKNSKKQYTLKDFKRRGMPVKVVSVTDWSVLREASDREAYLIWLANYSLAIRRMIYIYVSLLILAAAVVCWVFMDLHIALMEIAIVCTIISLVAIIVVPFWRRQLNGFKFFCKLRRLPAFSGFAAFLFGLARILSLIYSLLGILILLILAFIASSSEGAGAFNFYDRLGIPKNMGQDELIESGIEQDEAAAVATMNWIEDILTELDYTISKNNIESDYKYKLEKIEEINRKIADREKEELTFDEKQELKRLKEKAAEAKSKLDKNYQDAKSDLAQNYGKQDLNIT